MSRARVAALALAMLAWPGAVAGRADGEAGADAWRVLERETRAWAERLGAGVVAVAPRVGGPVRALTEVSGRPGAGLVLAAAEGRHEVLTTTDVIGSRVERASVVTADGRALEATVVGRDPVGGAVLLACPESPGTPLPLGRSAGVRVGDRVATAGIPWDPLHADRQVVVSVGAVTARYAATDHWEEVGVNDRYTGPVLETDAAVNPGSFGGPLCDRQGRVVGLLVATLTHERWLGTAAPIDAVRARLPALRAGLGREPTGLVTVGDTGVMLAPAVGEAGVVVLAAAGSALTVGDVIAAIDGAPVADVRALAVALFAPRAAASGLTVRRDGEERRVAWIHPARPRGQGEGF